MSAFDALRSTLADVRPGDPCVCDDLAMLRAAVAEHDALRDAVRGYLATVGAEEVTPRCAAAVGCSAPATGIVRWGPSAEGRREGRYLCHAHAVSGDHHASLPPRVVALRALAALVRS